MIGHHSPCSSCDLVRCGRVLYLDIDSLVLGDVSEMWQLFGQFGSTQLAAMAPEGEVRRLANRLASIALAQRFATAVSIGG